MLALSAARCCSARFFFARCAAVRVFWCGLGATFARGFAVAWACVSASVAGAGDVPAAANGCEGEGLGAAVTVVSAGFAADVSGTDGPGTT